MELPSYDNDHYELDNAEEINNKYPDSFHIPSKELRQNLQVGDLVKLIFRMEFKEDPEQVEVERMWVEIKKNKDGFYVGELDNDPCKHVHVVYGQIVVFKPEHVIEVYEEIST